MKTEEIKKKINILLISENEEENEELKKAGCSNIDRFKSIIRADKYFRKNPDKLDQYHLALLGNSTLTALEFYNFQSLDYLVHHREDIIDGFFLLKCPRTVNGGEIYSISMNKRIEAFSYQELIDKIISQKDLEEIIKKYPEKEQKRSPVTDYENPNRIPLPKKKEEIKILYLDAISINPHAKEIAEELGLNVTFKEDNNFAIRDHIRQHLGEYDIIIASQSYSRNLPEMNIESTEQCKDTGRDLVLLLTYESRPIPKMIEEEYDSLGIGTECTLRYSFGGRLATESTKKYFQFPVLRKETIKDKRKEDDKSEIKVTLEQAVNLYNNELQKTGKNSIEDVTFKTSDEYKEEYDKKEQEKELEPIYNYKKLYCQISNYLYFKSKNLVPKDLPGLKIIEEENGIKIINLYQGKPLCAITMSKGYPKDNLNIFTIEKRTKKGTLGSPTMVGIYTKSKEKTPNIPRRPNEEEQRVLSSIIKKVDYVIEPLNENASQQYESNKTYKRKNTSPRKRPVKNGQN